MRSFRHWTARYVRDRILDIAYQRRHPDSPLLTRYAIAILADWLGATDRGWEWGAGRSTSWFAARVAHLTSIEHDPHWVGIVTRRLDELGLRERVLYRGCALGGEGAGGSPYVGAISSQADESLDFCLVDGRLRDLCILACLPKLRPGGLLVLDDAHRYIPREPRSHAPFARSITQGFESEHWRDFYERVADWRRIWTTDGIKDTAFWIKPAAVS